MHEAAHPHPHPHPSASASASTVYVHVPARRRLGRLWTYARTPHRSPLSPRLDTLLPRAQTSLSSTPHHPASRIFAHVRRCPHRPLLPPSPPGAYDARTHETQRSPQSAVAKPETRDRASTSPRRPKLDARISSLDDRPTDRPTVLIASIIDYRIDSVTVTLAPHYSISGTSQAYGRALALRIRTTHTSRSLDAYIHIHIHVHVHTAFALALPSVFRLLLSRLLSSVLAPFSSSSFVLRSPVLQLSRRCCQISTSSPLRVPSHHRYRLTSPPASRPPSHVLTYLTLTCSLRPPPSS